MIPSLRFLIVTLFLAGFSLVGIFGTSTSMTFIWPCYAILGVAAVLSIGFLFKEVSFTVPRWPMIAVLALVGYLLIRASESPVIYFAREDTALIIAAFVCYALFLSLLTTQKRRMALVYTLASLVGVNLLLAGLQSVTNTTLWIIPGYERTYTERVGGLFNNPDHYTAFLAVLAPLWVSLAVLGRAKQKIRIGWAALSAFSLVAVFANRGGVAPVVVGVSLVALVAIGSFLSWRNLSRVARGSALAAVWGAVLLACVIAIVGAPKSQDALGPESGSYLVKESGASLPLLWKAGLKQAQDTPLAGAGSRMSYIYERSLRSRGLSSNVADPEFVHNEVIQMVADYGLIGLFLISALLILHLGCGFRFVKAYASFRPQRGQIFPKSDHLALTIGAIVSLLGIGTLSMFDFVMHLPVFAMIAAVLLASLAAPDPMANALQRKADALIPGGNMLFAGRTGAFACGVILVLFGAVFSRSEFNYEMARIAFEADAKNFKAFRHLQAARAQDPRNPHIYTLSAHAQVASLSSDMAPPVRRQGLEKADEYFTKARELYPQDVFAAVGHAAVLDELGLKESAKQRLADARTWGPLYGNLMRAEAEHHLRHGEIAEASKAFRDSLDAGAFRNIEASREGLQTIAEWKLIAQQNGIQYDRGSKTTPPRRSDQQDRRELPSAIVEQREVAGELIPDPEVWFGE